MAEESSSLQQLARAHGIQTSYESVDGEKRVASEETLKLLLRSFGVDVRNRVDARGLLEEAERKERQRAIEPVHVLWGGSGLVAIQGTQTEFPEMWLEIEGGERRDLRRGEVTWKAESATVRLRGLPAGYHKLVLENQGKRKESLLISAPEEVYHDPRKKKEWGLFVPLYAAHSERSWGAGNFRDWQQFTRWAAERGAGVVATLPIVAAFLGKKPFEPSPYSPASRLFWNEFFVDVEAVPEFADSAKARGLVSSAAFREKLQGLRKGELIDYREGMKLRRQVLEILAAEFFERDPSERREKFEIFVRKNFEVREYAKFRAATEFLGKPWPEWPTRARNGRLPMRTEFYEQEVAKFYRYCQWVADEQMNEVLRACEDQKMKFYLDLPLGVNPHSYDAWKYWEFFAQGVNAGAPPDAFFTKGQDWGFPPLHPERMRALQYKYVIDYLRFQISHTGMLRLDHVMGLHRLYWVPHGRPATEGAYVRYPAEELYAILAVESHRYKCVLVGENLGTVPKETNEAMERHKVEQMYVLQFAGLEKGRLAGPKANEVASLNTHDVPPWAAQWNGKDIADRTSLGLLSRKEALEEQTRREKWKRDLVKALRKSGDLPGGKADAGAVLAGVLSFLGKSDAKTVLVNIEDCWLEEKPQNVPGTSDERPNWRRKTRFSLEEIMSSEKIAGLLRMVRDKRRS